MEKSSLLPEPLARMSGMMKYILTLCAICIVLPLALNGWAEAGSDEKAIHEVMDRFVGAWNRHDAKAFAAVFTEDADFTNWRGVGASGRAKIEEFHALIFATIFNKSVLKYTDIKIRFARPDVAAVDVHWDMTGAVDAHGNPVPERFGLLSLVMTRDAGTWQIAVMHNLDLSALPPVSK
jgi:uncharacterized protein (TIGR02246 family)